jgi:hypothetical protein
MAHVMPHAMPHFSSPQRRRWSLSLIVILLLHWTLGVCAAVADVVCIEANGSVVLERAGQPCAEETPKSATEKASDNASGKACIDFTADDHHDPHDSLPSFAQLIDLPPPFLLPALGDAFSASAASALTLPLATGPPVPSRSVVLRKTTVLLI